MQRPAIAFTFQSIRPMPVWPSHAACACDAGYSDWATGMTAKGIVKALRATAAVMAAMAIGRKPRRHGGVFLGVVVGSNCGPHFSLNVRIGRCNSESSRKHVLSSNPQPFFYSIGVFPC